MTLLYRGIDNARIQAFESPIVAAPIGFRGGPVITDEKLFLLRHTRERVPYDSFKDDAIYESEWAGEYCYAGPVYNHFGHFMAEMVHRIIPSRERGLRHPFIFVTTDSGPQHTKYAEFPDFVKEILAFLNVKGHEVRVVSSNTIVEKLHVVEQGADIGGGPKPKYLEQVRQFSIGRLDEIHGDLRRPEKLYVSRSGLVPAGLILGERYLESELEDEGFCVFRPEEHRFAPQLDHYRKAKIIIFPEGSACHGTELLGSEMMNKTFLMPRREPGMARVFMGILAPRSKGSEFMEGCVDYLGSTLAHAATGNAMPHLGASWIDIPILIDFLRSRGIAQLPNISQQRYVDAAKTDYSRYLEYTKSFLSWSAMFADELTRKFEGKLSGVPCSSAPSRAAPMSTDVPARFC